MKMKCVSWMRRVFVGITVFCLTMANFGARPLSRDLWELRVNVYNVPNEIRLCTARAKKKTITIDVTVHVSPTDEWVDEWMKQKASQEEGKETERIDPIVPNQGTLTVRAKLGKVQPASQTIEGLGFGKVVGAEFKYTASKPGRESLAITVDVGSFHYEGKPITFEVEDDCPSYKIRGHTDMGAVMDAQVQYLFGWDFTGSYDIVGTIEPREDGTLSGEGTVSYFLNTPQGALEDVSCQHVTPWQGQTTVAIKADPDAWEEDGVLKLQLHVEPMQVNSTTTDCVSPSGGGSMEIPGYTCASLDLNFDPIPVEGGVTSLIWHFSSGKIEHPMELIVVPEEAGS